MKAEQLISEMDKYASAYMAVFALRFFKTGSGEYGEGDKFIGVRVPVIRKICRDFKDMELAEVQKLLDSPFHELRMAGVIILVSQYKRSKNSTQKQKIFDLYLLNIYKGRINNWDIIDVTCAYIVGEHLVIGSRDLLFELANNDDLWQRRVAIVSTFAFIRKGDPSTTIEVAEILLNDKQDLIHKAVGWLLREVGKSVDEQLLTDFLDKHAKSMPRTMLRYSIEKLSLQKRSYYLSLKD